MKAIYIRTSTSEQKIDSQRKVLRDYCKRKKWKFKEYIDKGISGSKDSRPEFNILMEGIRECKIDTVIVYKIDRLARSMQHFLQLMQEFENRNVNFISVTQPINTTGSSGKLMLQILGAFAEFERNLIRERVKAGKERSKKKQGRKKKKVNIKYLRKLRKDGLSFVKIAKEYNKNHRTHISHQTVFNLLKNK